MLIGPFELAERNGDPVSPLFPFFGWTDSLECVSLFELLLVNLQTD